MKKLLCMILLLAMLVACRGVDAPPDTTAVPNDAPYVVLQESDGSWLTLTTEYISAASYVGLTAELEGASFVAKALNGSLKKGEETAISAEFASGDTVLWGNGDWTGEETFVDITAYKDGYIVGYATVLVRDRATVEFAIFEPGENYTAEIVKCVELPASEGKYQAVPSAQIEEELEKLRASVPPLGMINLYFEGSGFRSWDELAGSSALHQVRVALTGEGVSFRVKAVGGDLYGVGESSLHWGDMIGQEKVYLPGSTVVWQGNTELVVDRDTQTVRNKTAYIEITVFKGDEIVGYGLVKIGDGEVNYHTASVVACEELSEPITEAELASVFASLES